MTTELQKGRVEVRYPADRIRNEKIAGLVLFLFLFSLTLFLVNLSSEEYKILTLFGCTIVWVGLVSFVWHRIQLANSHFIIDDEGITCSTPRKTDIRILWNDVKEIEDEFVVNGAFVLTDVRDNIIKIHCLEHRSPFLEARELALYYLSARFGEQRLPIESVSRRLRESSFEDQSRGSGMEAETSISPVHVNDPEDASSENKERAANPDCELRRFHARSTHPLILIISSVLAILFVAFFWEDLLYDLKHPLSAQVGHKGNWVWYVPLVLYFLLFRIRKVEIYPIGLIVIYPLWSKKIYFSDVEKIGIQMKSDGLDHSEVADRIELVLSGNKSVRLPKTEEGDELALKAITKAWNSFRDNGGVN